jgi:cytochrome P450
LVRKAVDYDVKLGNGRGLNTEEICQVLLSIHFTMTATPSILCAHAVKELTNRPDLWNQIREELNPQTTSLNEVLRHKTLNACVIEGARLNTHVSIVVRSTFKHSYIGPYYLGNSDVVSVPGALLFESEMGNDTFPEAGKYNPERFLREESDPMTPRSFWLWGAGVHSCPGRNISIGVAKLFMIHLIHHFDAKLVSTTERDYYTLNTLPYQNININLTPIFN